MNDFQKPDSNNGQKDDRNPGQESFPGMPFPVKTVRRGFSRLGLAAFAATFLANLVIYLLAVLWPELLSDGLRSTLLSALLLQVLGLGLAALIARPVPAAAPERHPMTVTTLLKLLCIGYALLYIGNLVGSFFASFLSQVSSTEAVNPLEALVGETPLWAQALVMLIIGPLFEELFFRRVLIDRMSVYGDRVAILISALMFGLFHGNFFQFFYAFALGLLFGYVYVRTGNIWYSVGLHAALNLLGGVIPSLLLAPMTRVLDALNGFIEKAGADPAIVDPSELLSGLMIPEMLWLLLYDLAIFALLITGAVFLFTNARRIRLNRAQLPLPAGNGFAITFGNVGMALYVAFCVILFALSMSVG